MKRQIIILILMIHSGVFSKVMAQQGFGTSNPNKDAVADISSANKGLLIPRLALSALNSPLPLQAHVAGMVVYNTAISAVGPNQVIPGYYFNNGAGWVNIIVDQKNTWYIENTTLQANSNTQNIYQLGNVGIGTNQPTSKLNIVGDGTTDPVMLQNMQSVSNTDAYKIMMVNNSSGLIYYTDYKAPSFYLLQSKTSGQNFADAAFNSSSSEASAAVLSFGATDETVAAGFATLAGNVITITAEGNYDLMASCNLLLPSPSPTATYSTSTINTFMNISLEIQMRTTAADPWVTIASVSNTLNYSSFGLTTTLKPTATLQNLQNGNQLRLIIFRGAGISKTGGADAVSTGSLGTGVLQNKFFKITKYN